MKINLSSIIEGAAKFAAITTTAIMVVEDKTTAGADKKAEVIAEVKNWINSLAKEDKIPAWLANILTLDMILGFAIDKIVDRLNKEGIFEKGYEALKG